MAAAADSAEGCSRPRPGARWPSPASFTLCLLAAGALAITLFGRPHAPAISAGPARRCQRAKPRRTARRCRRSDDGAVTGPVTKPVYAGKALLADPALIENTAQGPLPRIADDGRKPMTAYAAPAAAAANSSIAIVVSGPGLSRQGHQGGAGQPARRRDPGLCALCRRCRPLGRRRRAQRGHEVLLEVPMEPFDFPDSDPGPHTLRAGQDEEANIQRLTWALSRFTGYAGVTNLLGQRFLSDSEALSPALTYLTRRGLYFFDNGAASQSVAPDRGGPGRHPVGAERRRRWTASRPRWKSTAVCRNWKPRPAPMAARWVRPFSIRSRSRASPPGRKGLQARGFVLVPVSAIVNAPKQ